MEITVLSRRQMLARLAAIAAVGACAKQEPDSKDVDPELPSSNTDVFIDPVTSNERHYITTCCGEPSLDGATWTLEIRRSGEVLAIWTLAWLESLAARDVEHTLMCISAGPGSQRISNAIWSGLPVRELLELSGVSVPDEVVTLRIDAAEGYSTGLPVTDLDKPLWLMWRMNGVRLPENHGFPARFITPGRYGMKNPKWPISIDLLDVPYLGYWETRGWSDPAPYRPNTLVQYPRNQDIVVEGTLRVVGTAYAGSDPVVSVDVSIDGGEWTPATIDYQNGPNVWCLWSFVWEAVEGQHTILVRCTTESGAMSDTTGAAQDLTGWGGSMEVQPTVR